MRQGHRDALRVMAWWMTKARRLLGGGTRPDPKRRDGMTLEERFLFDLEGYLVIKRSGRA